MTLQNRVRCLSTHNRTLIPILTSSFNSKLKIILSSYKSYKYILVFTMYCELEHTHTPLNLHLCEDFHGHTYITWPRTQTLVITFKALV